jgi:hypothetical protein
MRAGAVNREGVVSISVLVMAILGGVSGAVVGYLLNTLPDRRLLAVVAALVAVGVAGAARRLLNRVSPSLSMMPTGARIPPAVWAGIVLSALVAGLAGHDLVIVVGDSWGAVMGLVSGVLGALAMALCLILYGRGAMRDA